MLGIMGDMAPNMAARREALETAKGNLTEFFNTIEQAYALLGAIQRDIRHLSDKAEYDVCIALLAEQTSNIMYDGRRVVNRVINDPGDTMQAPPAPRI